MDHRGSSPPCTGLHCQPEELIGARPTAAPGHGSLPRLHGKDEELSGVQFRASPKREEQRGDRAMAVKKRQRWRSVRAMLNNGERGWRAGGTVEDGGVLPFL
jgi:hypothetical protein